MSADARVCDGSHIRWLFPYYSDPAIVPDREHGDKARYSQMAREGKPGRRPLIVWCAAVNWNGIRGTDRHIASELSEYADILWVDPPVSPITPSRYRHGTSRWPVPTFVRVNDTMYRLSPTALPFHSRALCRGLTAHLLRAQIRRTVARLGRTPSAIIASHLDDVLGICGKETVNVFYGTDDYVAGAELMRISRRFVETSERRQLAKADVVVAITPLLAERWRKLGFQGPMAVIPNGVQAEHYRNIARATPAAVDLPPPIAGFVGHLSSRIDIRLLEDIVEAGTSLLLVGPYDAGWEPDRFRKLVNHPRVRWVGPVAFDDLPSYLRLIDVGVTPYADSEFNRSSFPLKTLEYLAAGKAVVSTAMPAVEWLQTDLITVAGPDDFGRRTREATACANEPMLVERRIAFAASHSWKQRAMAFARAIGLKVPN